MFVIFGQFKSPEWEEFWALMGNRGKMLSVVSGAGLFGSGSGLNLTKISGLIRAWDVLFVLDAQKHNQNRLGHFLIFQT